jgi:outer membrane protein OmpA-like peptidoglycan-associated protein/opacity protein-like surface antigen
MKPVLRLRPFGSRFLSLLTLLALLSLTTTEARSQAAANRISFGFNGGGNKYFGSFTDNQFWFSGEAFVRWNVFEEMSLHLGYGAGQMRIKVNEQNIRGNEDYFGPWDPANGLGVGQGFYPKTQIRREEKNTIRHGGVQALLSLNFWPKQTFVPYITGGIELLNFEPRNKDQNVALPNNASNVYDKNVVGFLAGLGYELYLTDNVVFNGRGLLHLTGTPYLDDYAEPSNEDNQVTGDAGAKADNFMTFGIGFSYYIFGYVDSDKDGLTDGDERNIYKTDPFNADTDGDGLQDGREVKVTRTEPTKPDTDGDGLTDGEEVETYKTQPTNADSDADGLNDGSEIKAYNTNPLEADTDGDELKDGEEVNNYKTKPTDKDTDADGLTDGDEARRYGSDPIKTDTDSDGLIDGDEVNGHKTDPKVADTDQDGLADGREVNEFKTNPLSTDTDGDLLKDGDEVNRYRTNPTKKDTDGDTLADGDEVTRTNTNPLVADTDGDTFNDAVDRCPLIKGVAPDGCPPKPPVNTVTNFPGVLFIVNTDNFDLTIPGTLENLNQIKALVEQCKDIRVEIEGHASSEGEATRNQELSEMRAARVKSWLIEQGVSAEKISRTVGYGSTKPLVPEPEPTKTVKKGKKTVTTKGATPEQVEAARKQNRRIAVRVVETCK